MKKYPVEEWLKCSNCGNVGWYLSRDGLESPIQEQCESCYTAEQLC